MYYDIIDLKYLEKYKLELTFETGEKGIVDLSDYPEMGGVFSRFTDINYLDYQPMMIQKYFITKYYKKQSTNHACKTNNPLPRC